MSSATVTVHTLIVAACWSIGILLAVLNVVSAQKLGPLSVVFIVLGATLYIKVRIDAATAAWLAAYHVGREVATLRPPRSH